MKETQRNRLLRIKEKITLSLLFGWASFLITAVATYTVIGWNLSTLSWILLIIQCVTYIPVSFTGMYFLSKNETEIEIIRKRIIAMDTNTNSYDELALKFATKVTTLSVLALISINLSAWTILYIVQYIK